MDLRNLRDYSFELLGHSVYYNVLGGAQFRLAGGGLNVWGWTMGWKGEQSV